jgi:hypothetical protein
MNSQRPNPAFAPTLLLLAAALSTGCPSPEAGEKYQTFLDETEEEREDAANVKMDQGGSLADVNGDFLLALSAVIAVDLPLQFYATVTFTPGGEGGTVEMSLQPLSLTQGSTTEPRMPVGDSLTIGPVAVNAAGAFELPITEPVMVTGEANPITGSDIVATLNLSGSMFAAVRVQSVDMLPTDVVFACPEGGVGEESGGSEGSSGGGSTG